MTTPDTLLMTTRTLGYSVNHVPITGHFLNVPEGDIHLSVKHPIDTLFFGVFHGDEGISGALMTVFLEFLTRHKDWEAFGIPVGTPVLIVPVVNPDGMAAVSRVNARGVDLNRNFPTRDWISENEGTPYFSGPDAASEPETRMVIELIETYRPRKIISVHSPYRVLNYDGPALPLAEAMSRKSGYPATEDIGYATPGSFGTYAGKERNIPMVTLELPENEPLDQVWRDNRDALLEAIRF